ncbi:MAG: Unspecific monooxygenase [Chitinophagaceae bacterium]|nr:Unspecific monooxygenase [Chitinophagaceae bacterium]
MNSSFATSYREPETLKRKFFLGNTRQALKDPVDFLKTIARDYGSIVTTNFFGKKYFVLQHPEYIRHVLLQNHKVYFKPGATKLLGMFLGEGLSTSNGELWVRQRRIMQPAFHKQRLPHMVDIINDETTLFISKLKNIQPGSEINIGHEFLQLTISIISRAMFSTALTEEMDTMVYALEELAIYASSWMKSIIKIPANWPTKANKKFKNNCKIFDDIIYGIIERRKKEINKSSCSLQGDLLDMLINYYDEDIKDGMSGKQLRDEVTTMFMAGHETTAQTLSWIMYHLAKEKKINQSVKEEQVKNLCDRFPSLDDMPQLVYTKQVVQEALRCYPPIWAIVRKPLINDEINGIKITGSSNVLINIIGMHHHPGYWDTPDDFNPEHFTADQLLKRPPYVYLPFGGGPRLCLGNNFATMVMQIVVSRLCRHFEFDVPAGYVPKVEPNITLRARGGIYLIIKEIK